MRALLIWALMSFGPQGEEVAQSVHLTRAECQASLSKIVATGPQMILGQANGMKTRPGLVPTPKDEPLAVSAARNKGIGSGITAPPDPTIRSGIKGNATDKDHKCVQFSAKM